MAIVGAPDDILGERVCAFVVVKTDQQLDLESISTYLRDEKA
ncbi:hypothetical protein KPY62_01295 [Psychrobacter sp. TAE2020]|nr:hypothetical protein [Psychrobacter sp. TAE2020]MBU5615757.1 hypothetical protein [Psychrobacter sp. TAE2020]